MFKMTRDRAERGPVGELGDGVRDPALDRGILAIAAGFWVAACCWCGLSGGTYNFFATLIK
jgi:hypothetical protein